MIERILTFLVIGFLVFSPQIQSFWSSDPVAWYANYLIWFALIALCIQSARHESQQNQRPRRE